MSERKGKGLTTRLADLANEVERVKVAAHDVNGEHELLLAKLLVDVDKVTSRLAKHRTALEAAASK